MPLNDDSDIKIFNSEKRSQSSGDNGLADILQAIDSDRKNGNTSKARIVGKNLASIAKTHGADDDIPDFLLRDYEASKQVGLLLLFAAEAGLNYFMPSTQLATIAIMALRDELSELEDSYFTDVLENPAYSFYYLSIRKGSSDVDKAIGETFAMLCKHENTEKYIDAGRQIYNVVLHEVEKQVKRANFQ